MSWIDSAFGIYPASLSLRSERSSVLAANIANSDTPGYKAKDYDFRNVLKNLGTTQSVQLKTTNSQHVTTANNSQFGDTLYRVPTKYSSEGNTVEQEVEQAAFSDNAVRYQTSLQFLSGTISGLRLAIKGQ